MISHKHKCIFIHIPRTGGTSIEKALTEADWWKVDKKTKHLDCKTAKNLYKDNWNEYFKFTIVRNPWDMYVSFFCFEKRKSINYFQKNVNKKFKNYIHKTRQKNNAYYFDKDGTPTADIYIRFENIQSDFNDFSDKLHIPREQLPFLKSEFRKDKKHYSNYYDDESIEFIEKRHKKIIDYFNYRFENK